MSAELHTKLGRIAAQQGRDGESLSRAAVERLVGYDQWLVREVEKVGPDRPAEVREHEDVAAPCKTSPENDGAPEGASRAAHTVSFEPIASGAALW